MTVKADGNIDLQIGLSPEDAVAASAIYEQYRRWSKARQSIVGWLSAYFVNIAAATVQTSGMLLFAFVLHGYLRGGGLTHSEHIAASWLGFFGFVGAYFGVAPFILKGRIRRSVHKALRKADPDLFKQPKRMALSTSHDAITLQIGDRRARVSRSETLRFAETNDLGILIIGGAMFPLRRTITDQTTYDAIKNMTAEPRLEAAYFARLQAIEYAQLAFGILVFALNFSLFLQLPHGR